MNKEKLIVAAAYLVLTVSVIAGVVLILLGGYVWMLPVICLGLPMGFLISSLRSIAEEERWIIEVFGGYCITKGPGLVSVLPVVMKAREAISVWEQRYALFKREIKIDFLNGSATPRDVYVYVQCNEEEDPDAPRKMVYEIKNVKDAMKTLVESGLRTFWNGLGIDTGIKFGRGASNLLEEIEEIEDLRKLTEEEIKQIEAEEREVSRPEARATLEARSGKAWIDDLQGAAKKWGLKIIKITVGDWDLDKTIIQARENVFKGQMAAKEAEFRAAQHGLEAGKTHVEIAQRLNDPKSSVKLSKKDSNEMAYKYVSLFRSIEEGQAQVVEWRGGDKILPAIAQASIAIDVAKKTGKKGSK